MLGILGCFLYLTFGVERLAKGKIAKVPSVEMDFESLRVGLAPLRVVCSKLDLAQGENVSVSVEKLVAELDFKSILSKKVKVRRIVLEKPIIEVKGEMGSSGGNLWDVISSTNLGKQAEYDVSIDELMISGGEVKVSNGEMTVEVEEIEGKFTNLSPNAQEGVSEFNLTCRLMGGGLTLEGAVSYPLVNSLNIKGMGEGIDIATIGEMGLFPPSLEVHKGKAHFAFEGAVEGEHIKLVGELELTDMSLTNKMEGRLGKLDIGRVIEVLGGKSEKIRLNFNIDTTFEELKKFREKISLSK